MIDDALSTKATSGDWKCSVCGGMNMPMVKQCWLCGAACRVEENREGKLAIRVALGMVLVIFLVFMLSVSALIAFMVVCTKSVLHDLQPRIGH